MDVNEERKSIAQAVFAITGDKLPEGDPLITAALFYAQQMRDAGRAAAADITQASEGSGIAERLGEAVAKRLVVDRSNLSDELEARLQKWIKPDSTKLAQDLDVRMQKWIKVASKGQSGHTRLPFIPAWYAAVAFVAGAAVLVISASVAGGFNFSRSDDAALGRSLGRALPTLDPEVNAKLIDHMRKHPG